MPKVAIFLSILSVLIQIMKNSQMLRLIYERK